MEEGHAPAFADRINDFVGNLDFDKFEIMAINSAYYIPAEELAALFDVLQRIKDCPIYMSTIQHDYNKSIAQLHSTVYQNSDIELSTHGVIHDQRGDSETYIHSKHYIFCSEQFMR